MWIQIKNNFLINVNKCTTINIIYDYIIKGIKYNVISFDNNTIIPFSIDDTTINYKFKELTELLNTIIL